MKHCHSCGAELKLANLKNAKQRRAAHVCEACVRASMTPAELQDLLNPKEEQR